MIKKYTVYGPHGLIGTRLSYDDVVELIRDFEPGKNPTAVMNNTHIQRSHKSGQLTIVVLRDI